MGKLQGVRTIRNGRVRFFGKIYIPSDRHCEYKGELDGTRWLFMSYMPFRDSLAMWGDERRYRASCESDEAYDKDCQRREANINKKGQIRWYSWKPKEEVRNGHGSTG